MIGATEPSLQNGGKSSQQLKKRGREIGRIKKTGNIGVSDLRKEGTQDRRVLNRKLSSRKKEEGMKDRSIV